MYYVYFLKNTRTKRIYISYTNDLKRRFAQHSSRDKCWILVFYEAYRNEEDAREREKKLKNYENALGHLKNRIKRSTML